jgi:hypothetical protein
MSCRRLVLLRELVSEQHLHPAREAHGGDRDALLAHERLEIRLHLARALVAVFAALREGLHHDALELRRVVRADVARQRVVALAG